MISGLKRRKSAMKTFVVGDIHGAHKALLQCFERSNFHVRQDRLIVIGDVCDGYPYVKECLDELLKIQHCDLVTGNHDLWALDWALHGAKPMVWTSQGGDRTILSYHGGPMPQAHVEFLKSGHLWIERGDQVFVHGGFDPGRPIAGQNAEVLVWDRSLLAEALKRQRAGSPHPLGPYRDIFIGHTPTEVYGTLQPLHACNVWDIDTGAGWSGKLTIMDADSKEYWQSDLTPGLHGGTPGRF